MSRLPELYIDDAGIFREYHYDKIISKSCAMFVADERNRLSEIKRPLLVQFRHLEGFATDTRTMTLEFVLKSVSALAYAVNIESDSGRKTKETIESFFKITPWPIPVKIFHDEKEALDWLRQFTES